MLVAVCADKGAPGATTTALAMGARWPGDSVVVVECDESGGDIGLRLHRRDGQPLTPRPTVVALAAAARADASNPLLVARTSHRITEHLSVVPGHLGPEQAGGLAQQWPLLAQALRSSQVDVIADLGRVSNRSASLDIAAAADLVVVVGRADVRSWVRLQERLRSLGPALADRGRRVPRFWPVLVCPRRYGRRLVEDLQGMLLDQGIQIEGASFVGWDATGVRLLESGHDLRHRGGRTVLARTAGNTAVCVHRTVESLSVDKREAAV